MYKAILVVFLTICGETFSQDTLNVSIENNYGWGYIISLDYVKIDSSIKENHFVHLDSLGVAYSNTNLVDDIRVIQFYKDNANITNSEVIMLSASKIEMDLVYTSIKIPYLKFYVLNSEELKLDKSHWSDVRVRHKIRIIGRERLDSLLINKQITLY